MDNYQKQWALWLADFRQRLIEPNKWSEKEAKLRSCPGCCGESQALPTRTAALSRASALTVILALVGGGYRRKHKRREGTFKPYWFVVIKHFDLAKDKVSGATSTGVWRFGHEDEAFAKFAELEPLYPPFPPGFQVPLKLPTETRYGCTGSQKSIRSFPAYPSPEHRGQRAHPRPAFPRTRNRRKSTPEQKRAGVSPAQAFPKC